MPECKSNNASSTKQTQIALSVAWSDLKYKLAAHCLSQQPIRQSLLLPAAQQLQAGARTQSRLLTAHLHTEAAELTKHCRRALRKIKTAHVFAVCPRLRCSLFKSSTSAERTPSISSGAHQRGTPPDGRLACWSAPAPRTWPGPPTARCWASSAACRRRRCCWRPPGSTAPVENQAYFKFFLLSLFMSHGSVC